MNFAHASQGVNHAVLLLNSITQVNNTVTAPAEKCISWNKRKPGIQKNIYYAIEYQYLLDNQQYSLLLKDGSFFQFYFEFDLKDILICARLAYYPKPVKTNHDDSSLLDAAEAALERDDGDLYDHLFNWVELLETDIGRPANTSHIRFDYDSAVKSHSKSHLQFGAIQEFRIPSSGFPLPIAFIELCAPLAVGIALIQHGHLVFAKGNRLNLPPSSELIHLS